MMHIIHAVISMKGFLSVICYGKDNVYLAGGYVE